MPVGRKTKLNDEVEVKICGYLACGLPVKDACNLASVSERTYRRWIAEGKLADTGRKRKFWQASTRASSLAVSKLTGIVTAAAKKDWRAAAFILERRWPQEWARHVHADITTDEGRKEVVKHLRNTYTKDQLRGIRGILRNGNGNGNGQKVPEADIKEIYSR